MTTKSTIQADVQKLLCRKVPLTYAQIVSRVQEKHPDCSTSIKTVQWYASRLRRLHGIEVRVRRARPAH